MRLGTINATQGQLEEAFREYGVSGDTLRKAIAFYLAAAKYAQVPLSKNFRVPSVAAADGRRVAKRKPGRPRKEDGQEPSDPFSDLVDEVEVDDEEEPKPKLDPAIVAWVRRMPVGRPWPKVKRDSWFQTFRAIVDDVWLAGEDEV